MFGLESFFQTMPVPPNQFDGVYDPRLVVLSYLVATFASYIALDITGHLRDVSNTRYSRLMWICGGAFAMGAGIWSMHFIGMVAFSIPGMAMRYDPFWTGLSMLVAIGASGFAFYLLKEQTIKVARLALGGIILGLAIASMHYVGMQGMRSGMDIHYLPGLFFLSILIAIIASEVAIWLAIKSNQVVSRLRVKLKIVSAFIMGAAICGMHYTGMAAAVFTPYSGMHMHDVGSLNPEILSISIAGVTFLILGIAFFASTYKEALNQQLLLTARQAGMAEVAASVLHNVGNVLNSVSVSATIVSEKVIKSKLSALTDLNNLLNEHKDNFSEFITHDTRGKQIPEYISKLANYWRDERILLENETRTLINNIDHIKNIINMQQELSRGIGFEQIVSIQEVLDEALVMTGLDTNRSGIEVKKNYTFSQNVRLDKVKLLQILVNLLRNAKDSLLASANEKKIITISLNSINDKTFLIQIDDTGLGILPKNLTRIFAYGFTTKQDGHGYGLHSSAIAANEMGGCIRVNSDGVNGASFTLELPIQNKPL